ncbi:MAG: hypothetical protein Q9219_000730 [cf. Caloplaca sp. 3 TL-2023]
MPSPFTSSFASAAAGNTNHDNPGARARGESNGDWTRVNGATTTFRRPSLATNLSHQRDTSQNNGPATNQNPGVYVPPHMNSNYHSRAGQPDTRYTKDFILDLYRAQARGGSSIVPITELYEEGWNPPSFNGTNGAGWSRKDESKDGLSGPEICWDHDGQVQPLGLIDMTDEEQAAFSTSVNSPIKIPTQNINKDVTPNPSAPGRRTSVTGTQIANAYTSSSPSVRPGARRRESTDNPSNQVTSPTSGSRFGKEDTAVTPPPSLLRRRTDFKENNHGAALEEKGEGKLAEGSNPLSGLKRTSTGPLGSSLNGPSSPWSAAPQSAGFAPMGAFGNFALGGSTGQPPTPGEKKHTFGSLRGESRFKGLMNADSSEDLNSKIKEKASISSLERLAEASNEPATTDWGIRRRPQDSGPALHGDEQYQGGSAALGGDDASPPRHTPSYYGAANRSVSREDMGFSNLGSSETASFRELMQRRQASEAQPSQPQAHGHQPIEPMSPTDTNPYQSPEAERPVPEDADIDGSDYRTSRMPAAAGFGHPVRAHTANFDGAASDRSRTSSAGASRGLPNLGTLGGFAGLGGSNTWSAAPGAVGTPNRAMPSTSAGFTESSFGNLDDLTSPIHGHGVGQGLFGGVGNVGAIGSSSKMGSLFPGAMQEQMRGDRFSRDFNELHQRSGGAGNLFSSNPSFRENDNHSRPARGSLEEFLGNMDLNGRSGPTVSSPFTNEPVQPGLGQTSRAAHQPLSSTFTGTPSFGTLSSSSYFPQSQDQDRDAANQIPATQQKQMVMPDRMRWIYRDPQGNTQGPWSGLEMHDWYKAGFFSPELQVKKLEDADYEPLAQLIRRIGNSREPFLVPQIGIPHGNSDVLANSSAQPSGAASTASAASNPPQPPFGNSFPSFGTTLTAEQQNALERRKQEEQYLMARQKEHLAQHQVMLKQQGIHGMHSQQLHHHSSAHSLQSQPSFGSITSPTGYQPSPAQGPIQPPSVIPHFFESGRNAMPNLGTHGLASEHLPPLREDDLPNLIERLNAQRPAPVNYGGLPLTTGFPEESMHQRQVQQMLLERQRLQREQEQFGLQQQSHDDQRQTAERLEQFKYLRSQMDDQATAQQLRDQIAPPERMTDDQYQPRQKASEDVATQFQDDTPQKTREPLSLSEQVQKAVKESPAAQPQSPWAKVESGLPQPFPPPQSTSPLPAPSAQRNRQNVADALNAESRSSTQTPSGEIASATVAPWAKETIEGTRGPSLKEIQAIEARKAAQQEEVAAAARRQLAEQERLTLQQQQQVAPAPGLPATVNWANNTPGAVPGSAASPAWAKPNANKTAVATPVQPTKKTLAQIQKEEEARKNRAAASAAATNASSNASNAAALAGGKRYADLAGKAPLANAGQAQNNQAWTTVGAGGKAKTPAAPLPIPVRSVSVSNTPPAAPVLSKAKVAGKAIDKQVANDELQKWTRAALNKGLNAGIPVDDFVSQLLLLPPEADIISDSIYSSSQTLDGRRFADEFIRRRKLADKGVVPEAAPNGSFGMGGSSAKDGEGKGSGGGWSEVAKKGGQQQQEKGAEGRESFKVVAGKRKGRR